MSGCLAILLHLRRSKRTIKQSKNNGRKKQNAGEKAMSGSSASKTPYNTLRLRCLRSMGRWVVGFGPVLSTACSLLAHAFVGVLRSEEVRKQGTPVNLLPLTLPEVCRLLCSLLLRKLPEERALLSWSCWRRRHQLRAKRCHYRRRLERLQGGNG